MAKRNKQQRSASGGQREGGRGKSSLKLRRLAAEGVWELVHPPCAAERGDDLRQVHDMLAAGEIDIARDELIWLLEDCRDFVEAHKLLGELAAAEGDAKLARAHFGYAWQIGLSALPAGSLDAPLAYSRPANQPFLEAGKGLAWSLNELGLKDDAQTVLKQLFALDPSDPLGTAELIS